MPNANDLSDLAQSSEGASESPMHIARFDTIDIPIIDGETFWERTAAPGGGGSDSAIDNPR
jgi:hypothetical protein